MNASTSKKRGKRSLKPIAKRGKVPDLEHLMVDGRAIDQAIAQGVRDALVQHERAGIPVVVWENGKSVHKSASDALDEMDSRRKQRVRAKAKRRRALKKAA